MKNILKLFAVLAFLAGICLTLAACLAQESKPDYIPIYGGTPDDGE